MVTIINRGHQSKSESDILGCMPSYPLRTLMKMKSCSEALSREFVEKNTIIKL